MKPTKKLVTCKEAREMLAANSVVVVEWRPAELFEARGKYSNNDHAYVWLEP
jgi:hypothetical protein